MYFAMIHSVMAYGINVYKCATKTNLENFAWRKKRQFVQSVMQILEPTAPHIKELKSLPLDDLIIYSRIKFMHSFHFKKLPLSFAEMWQTNLERNPERALRNSNDSSPSC
jgi:hypothetical protein